ncbi:MAG: SWIM zinc finger domain-containing protein [Defluviitaleaceae bacterium]|nr:SWIM zinc finger domain-containing protein [Defluviitaleaceae bacterium]MCL2261994.1 SWIM zinc finger domain-containing protein [Defluviitaleaceae bacterium]
MRAFAYQSNYESGNLALALAPALTPQGVVEKPSFFRGFAAQPQVLARGLLVLADVAATRYFKYIPVALRDPVLSAQGDRLRAECFSACNGVYARLDLLQAGFDGEIGFGTTNVDIGTELRKALTQVNRGDKLHVNIGDDGLTTQHFNRTENIISMENPIHERPVKMPDRWVRALGNAAEIHRGMEFGFSLKGAQAQAFISSLPSVTGKSQAGWLVPSRLGVKVSRQASKDAVFVSGLHRLSALKRVMTNITAVTFFKPAEAGAAMVVAELPFCRITLSLTAEAWHGYSGEGALLESLAQAQVLEDSANVGKKLSFQSIIEIQRMAEIWNIDTSRAEAALAVLAVSGKLGYDAFDNAYFHRELPDDPNRILKDNPRLEAARKIAETENAVKNTGENLWAVRSGDTDYRVHYNPDQDIEKCTCTWYLKHLNSRGPCKHILAVQLKEGDF